MSSLASRFSAKFRKTDKKSKRRSLTISAPVTVRESWKENALSSSGIDSTEYKSYGHPKYGKLDSPVTPARPPPSILKDPTRLDQECMSDSSSGDSASIPNQPAEELPSMQATTISNAKPITEPESDSDWEDHVSEDGKPYKFNRKTGETKWEDNHNPKKSKKKKKKKKKIFGITLDYWYSQTKKPVPPLVVQTTSHLMDKGLNVKGIFRIPGNQSAIKALQSKFEKDEVVDFNHYDILTVAGLLKKWLNEYPGTILSNSSKQECYTALSEADLSKSIIKLYESIQKMPTHQKETLRLLIKLFSKIAENARVNEMTSSNIAILLGAPIIGVGRKATFLLQVLIDNYDFIFEGKEKVVQETLDFDPHASPNPSRFTPEALQAIQMMSKGQSMPAVNSDKMRRKRQSFKTVRFQDQVEVGESGEPGGPERKFTFLVKCGESDFGTRIEVTSSSVQDLRLKIFQKMELPFNSVLLYYDNDFGEYIYMPDSIDQIPEKAKLMIKPVEF